MRNLTVFAALMVTVVGCAGQTGGSSVLTSAGAQRPRWQQLMERARQGAAAGYTYEIIGPDAVFVFYNNPAPLCYTYMIPGSWKADKEPIAFRSKDGRGFVGMLLFSARTLEGVEGGNLLERARTRVTRDHEETLGQPLTGVELVQFESARPGTWKWKAAPVRRGELELGFGAKILVDLSPDAVVQISAAGTRDDDGLARRIIENLRTTSNPECYWPLLESTLKAGFPK